MNEVETHFHCDKACSCHQGHAYTSESSLLSSLLYRDGDLSCAVFPKPCHSRLCSKTCLCHGCQKKFQTYCSTELFCSFACYQRSGWEEKWERFITLYGNDIGKLKRRLRKERYRQTETGKDSRRREYEKRKRKKKEDKNTSSKKKNHTFGCQRAGCVNTFSLTIQTKNRCYCSYECRNVMRETRMTLKTTWQETHCRVAFLVWAFLKLMKSVCIPEE
jgi:hypothetical protein